MTTAMIGTISLNISFVFYLLVYLPQILHNRKSNHISSLSMGMHFILYSSYCLDLLYGFSCDLQWQYKTVSVVSLTLLVIQHIQITCHYHTQKKWLLFNFNLIFIFTAGVSIVYFFTVYQASVSELTSQIIGYLSRAGFLIYTLPQIMKNRALKSANAISIKFIYLSLTLSMLDMTSAWCLDWGWPNKLGSPLTMSLMLIMLLQIKKYNSPRSIPIFTTC
jgi:uncharacterized protein with PQ loop repeat